MNGENIISNESQIESGENLDAEKEKLDEATNEPRSFVEQNGDYEQSEAIQKALEELPLKDENTVLSDMPEVRDDLSEVTLTGEDDEKNEATPINLPGPQSTSEGDEDMQLISGPGRDDLPDGTGILEIPHETVEMADPLKDENTVLGNMPEVRDDLSDITLAGEDEGKEETTPINLPGPQPANEDVALSPDDVKLGEEPEPGPDPFDGRDLALSPDDVKNGAEVAKDHPGPGGNIAAEDDWESPNVNVALSPDDVKLEEGGKRMADVDLSPDDVKLEPAPDFEVLNEGERAVVDVIGRAIENEEYRAALFANAQEATSGHSITAEDQAGLSEMTSESFEFFAAEVEARLAAAVEEQTLAQVVHAVWRDLNPGGLVYVLTYKIPQYHLS